MREKKQMEIGLFISWFVLSFVVGIAANARARSAGGWFLIAVFVSPLIALLLVLVLPRGDATDKIFRPDGMLGKTPFRTLPTGEVEAMIQGTAVRFGNIAQMQFMTDPDAAIVSILPIVPSAQR
jgi:hypothetical protein